MFAKADESSNPNNHAFLILNILKIKDIKPTLNDREALSLSGTILISPKWALRIRWALICRDLLIMGRFLW